MTPLRQRLVEDLRVRNYSPRTVERYVALVARFAKHFGKSPDVLGADEMRAFQLHLIEKKVSWSLFNQAVCALRFFYGTTLGRTELVPMLPFARRPRKLPCVLSPEEVAQLLEAARAGCERMLFTTTYACGLRLEEVLHLEVKDIDSARMVLHVRQGKGKKDRMVPLSPKLLADLRTYWLVTRPARWLFGNAKGDGPLHAGTVQRRMRRAVKKAGLRKAASMHTLRHSYATHMLEAGVDVMTLQKILGHRQLSTTALYLHLRNDHLQRVPHLLEKLTLPAGAAALEAKAAEAKAAEAKAAEPAPTRSVAASAAASPSRPAPRPASAPRPESRQGERPTEGRP